MNTIKENVAQNLTQLRIKANLTQTALAEKLNYSDKSVSKWEHGEALPPIDVLKQLADIYGVSLDYLVDSPDKKTKLINESNKNIKSKRIITALSVSIIWFIATILYVVLHIFSSINYWNVFIFALPLTSILLIVFNAIWGSGKLIFVLISILIWSALLSIFVLFLSSTPWQIFLIGIPLQIATILWSNLIPKNKKPV